MSKLSRQAPPSTERSNSGRAPVNAREEIPSAHLVREALRKAERELTKQFIGQLPDAKEWEEWNALRSSGRMSKSELLAHPVWDRVRASGPIHKRLLKALGWASHSEPIKAADRQKMAILLAERFSITGNYALEQQLNLVRLFSQGKRGAPVKRRSAAVRALEIKLQSPKAGWPEITDKCCNCGQSEHTHRCQQVLRQEVIQLRRVLNELEIEIPGL